MAAGRAEYRGRLDGRIGATFAVTAVDGEPDGVRLRVWNADGDLVFDNRRGQHPTGPPQPISGGQITVRER